MIFTFNFIVEIHDMSQVPLLPLPKNNVVSEKMNKI